MVLAVPCHIFSHYLTIGELTLKHVQIHRNKLSRKVKQQQQQRLLKNYNIGVVQFSHSFLKNAMSPVLGTKYM
jgi:hypothetical protein